MVFAQNQLKGLCPESVEGLCQEAVEEFCPESVEGFCLQSVVGFCQESTEEFCPESVEGFCPESAEEFCRSQYRDFPWNQWRDPRVSWGICPESVEGFCPGSCGSDSKFIVETESLRKNKHLLIFVPLKLKRKHIEKRAANGASWFLFTSFLAGMGFRSVYPQGVTLYCLRCPKKKQPIYTTKKILQRIAKKNEVLGGRAPISSKNGGLNGWAYTDVLIGSEKI